MGTYPISLLTIPALGYLAALLTGSWAKGVTFGMMIHVIWTEIWNNGAGFVAPPGVLPPGSPPLGDLLVYYFWATLLFSITGGVMVWVFGWHPLLDGMTIVHTKADGSPDYARTGGLVARILVVLLIFFGSHVIFELHTEDFPAPWGGVVCTVGCILGWILFFFLLRSEYKDKDGKNGIFNHPGSLAVHTSSATLMQNDLSVYILFASLGHLVYITAYWIWEFVQGDIGTFITSLWYFYASLILSGVILIVMLIVGYFLVKRPESKKAKAADNSGSTPLLTPNELPPPEVPAQTSNYHMGSQYTYKNPWATQ